ncbi:hypothetical protein HanIR_Chr14g0692291 [Helianthus annuus]|nr:hypothetical protein HanIR_Chr14g0692291 [Helianthus annuus]
MGALQYILNLLVIYLGNLRSGFKRKSKFCSISQIKIKGFIRIIISGWL